MPMGPRRTEGFSLIELMVVCAIIGISVIAFAPSFVHSMADRRAAGALAEVVRLGRVARSDAIGTQRAHLVWIRPGFGPQNSGVVQLLRGTNAHCDLQNWLALSGLCTPLESDSRVCLEQLDLNTARWFRAPFQVRLRTVRFGREQTPDLFSALRTPETSSYALCYEPDGTTHWTVGPLANPITTFSELNANDMAGGAVMFTLGIVDNTTNTPEGMPRVFAFPLGTTPRRLR
jgi:prepilin-type N-terminal cleavage/methylation domain-containing protein